MGNGKTRMEELLLQLIDVVKEQGLELVKVRVELVRTREDLSSRIDVTNDRIDAVRSELGIRIDHTNHRIDGTNDRLDTLRGDLGGRIDDVKTEVVALTISRRGWTIEVTRRSRPCGVASIGSEQHLGLPPA